MSHRPKSVVVAEKCRKMRWRMRYMAKCRCGRVLGHRGRHIGTRVERAV